MSTSDGSETDTLLPSCDSDDELRCASLTSTTPRPPTPLPWRPTIILYLLNSTQPLVFELIFPFVNQMILEIGVVDDPKRVGFYSGVIESIFAFMTFIAIIPCSYISDRWGRKPVVLIGITGLAISVSLFGMSRSYWFMLVTRSLGGALEGSWSASTVMLAEMTDKSNQAAAFSGLLIAYRIGQVVGQPLGGFLAHPERHWSLFQSQFWYDYPYSLPCFVAAAFAMTAVIMGCFFLQETLPSKRKPRARRSKYGAIVPHTGEEAGSEASSATMPEERHPAPAVHRPPLRSVLSPQVISLLTCQVGMVLVSETLFALYPLYAFTPVLSGGLGLSEAGIAVHMSARSALCIAAMAFYTPLQRRLGTVRLFQLATLIWPLTVALMPLLNILARRGGGQSMLFDVLLFVLFTLWGIAGLSWAGAGIMVNEAAPSADALATINGLSQMAIALPQALAPAAANSLFAFSVDSHVAGGNLIWAVLLAFTFATALHSLTLKEAAHDWREELDDNAAAEYTYREAAESLSSSRSSQHEDDAYLEYNYTNLITPN